MKMERYAPVPNPGYHEICDLAEELARQSGVDRTLIALIRYPAHATPPEGERGLFMGWAARMRAEAAAILKERLAAQPRVRIRRRKLPRYKPSRSWTRLPRKNANPPPRRRNFMPPLANPPAAAPPGSAAKGASPQRPCRRDGRVLAFDALLFDNRIVA